MKRSFVVFAIFFVFFASSGYASFTQQINFQGRLTGSSGAPITNSTPVTFKLYDSFTGGNLISSDAKSITPDNNGVFNTLLNFDVSSFDGSDRWLEVVLNGQTLSPRHQISAVPYAYRAVTAESAVPGSIKTAMLAAGAVTTNELGSAAVTTAKLAPSGVTAGLYGDSTHVGVVTVDATGRVTAASAVLISGVPANRATYLGPTGSNVSADASSNLIVPGTGNSIFAGNVGIGTTNPVTPLEVGGVVSLRDAGTKTYNGGIVSEVGTSLVDFGINDGTGNRFGGSYTQAKQGGFIRVDARGEPNYPLFDFRGRQANAASDATSLAVILSSGNVGIGTTNPTSKLTLAGTIDAANIYLNGSIGSSGQILTSNGNAVSWQNPSGTTQWGNSGSNIYYSSGNVGIGTTAPAATFEVSTGGNHSLVVNAASGNVGIGTTAPLTTLQVKSGTNREIQIGNTAGSYTNSTYFTDLSTLGMVINLARPLNGDFMHSIFSYDTAGNKNQLGIVSRYDTVFVAGGAERMRILDVGNVGIGTTNPTSKLTVSGTIDATNIYLNGSVGSNTQVLTSNGSMVSWQTPAGSGLSGSGAASYEARWTGTSTLGTGLLYDNGTKMGIGTASPSGVLTTLTTNGQVALSLKNSNGGSNVTTIMRLGEGFDGDASGLGGTIFTNTLVNSALHRANRLQIQTWNTSNAINTGLFMDESGNVGIGTTAPSTTLDIRGTYDGNNTLFLRDNSTTASTSSGKIGFNSGGTDVGFIRGRFGPNGVVLGNGTNTDVLVVTGGNVGIGTTSPSVKLHVSEGTSGFSFDTNNTTMILETTDTYANILQFMTANNKVSGIKFGDPQSATQGYIRYDNNDDSLSFYSNGTVAMTLLSNQNVGIGTTNPGASLEVNGTVREARILTVSNDTGGILYSTDEGKTITVNSGSTQTITLPSAASDIGARFTIEKLGAGQVTVQAATGDKIADSSTSGSIYDNVAAETYATITVQVAKANQWVIVGGHGTWTTQ